LDYQIYCYKRSYLYCKSPSTNYTSLGKIKKFTIQNSLSKLPVIHKLIFLTTDPGKICSDIIYHSADIFQIKLNHSKILFLGTNRTPLMIIIKLLLNPYKVFQPNDHNVLKNGSILHLN
jgi:hypothetical protein